GPPTRAKRPPLSRLSSPPHGARVFIASSSPRAMSSGPTGPGEVHMDCHARATSIRGVVREWSGRWCVDAPRAGAPAHRGASSHTELPRNAQRSIARLPARGSDGVGDRGVVERASDALVARRADDRLGDARGDTAQIPDRRIETSRTEIRAVYHPRQTAGR